jgi:DNA (cytosine-5)-methyltransferase 1
MAAYYNEIDPFAVQWLRNLIAKNLIAPGDVDERSIRDVKPDDLRNYTQCHFFAGIGVWSYALRAAGWPDDLPVWTGSCPCQPFSAAGKQEGTADARHLWPEWFRLVREHRPVAIFGEQVAAAIRHDWLDLVSTDLEGLDYAIGSAVMGAHSVGAPHIRQRLFFVAESENVRHERAGVAWRRGDGLADDTASPRQQPAGGRPEGEARDETRLRGLERGCGEGGMEHAEGEQVGISGRTRESRSADGVVGDTTMRRRQGRDGSGVEEQGSGARRAASFWSACDWLPCVDGKARPVEPGTFPLAHGAPARVGRLRAYGNAINAETAVAFIEAFNGR